MSAVGVGTKYQCAINGVGYLLAANGYFKKDANVLVPRFSTGEQGLTDLDLFKSLSQVDFTGGSFQRNFADPTKFSLIQNMIPNTFDNLLYPTPAPTNFDASSYMAWRSTRVQNVIYKGELYFAANGLGSVASAYGAVYKYVPSTKTITSVLLGFTAAVTDMAVLNDKLYVATGGGGLYVFDGTTGATLTGVNPYAVVSFKDRIVMNGSTGSAGSGDMYSIDKDNNQVFLGKAGAFNVPVSQMLSYNSRVYIGKPDGLFIYDGVQISPLIDAANDYLADNFKYLAEYQGVMYFTRRNCVFSFNGSTIEKVLEFANYETIVYMSTGGNRLYVMTQVVKTSSDKLGTASDTSLYEFDGVGWFEYHHTTVSSTYATPIGFMYYGDDTYRHLIQMYVDNSGFSQVQMKITDQNKEFIAATSNVGTIISSEFDADFPNVDKYFDAMSCAYDNIAASDTIEMQFRVLTGVTWTAWQSLGSLTNASTLNTLKRFETAYDGTFRKIQFKIIVTRTATSNLAIRNWDADYYLSPDSTWQWDLTLQTMGSQGVPLPLLDNTTESKSAAELRDNIYVARHTDAPIGFEDIDFANTTGTHTSGVTTINVDTTKTFRDSGYIKIEDEIIKYTGRTSTSFTGCTRGVLGTSAAAHNTAGTKVNMYYRAVVKSINNERVITPNLQAQESQIQVTLQEASYG